MGLYTSKLERKSSVVGIVDEPDVRSECEQKSMPLYKGKKFLSVVAIAVIAAVASAIAIPLSLNDNDNDNVGNKNTSLPVTHDELEEGKYLFPDGFMFGASSSATQIEDKNNYTDWWYYGLPHEEGGKGKLPNPVGNAAMGYTMVNEDIRILEDMGLDSYRFSIEWGRVWPNGPNEHHDVDVLAYYRAQLESMKVKGITPVVTIHHFSNPIWVDNMLAEGESCSFSDTNMCGWHGPHQKVIIAALVKHTELLATELGDLIDHWCTLNEPVNYILSAWGFGIFPPGHTLLFSLPLLMDVFRGFLEAHSQMWDTLKAKDTIDADGDGDAAIVGFTLSVAEWVPAHNNKPSTDLVDVTAARNTEYAYNHWYTQCILNGTFDADWSQNATTMEQRPDWKGKLDFVGLQYQYTTGATGQPGLISQLKATPCIPGSGLDYGSSGIDYGGCLPPPADPNHWIPTMGYEFLEVGLYNIVLSYKEKYPNLPVVITESGIACNADERRAQHIVRNLEQIGRAIQNGANVKGYFHRSLTDSFEWTKGFEPSFGLYRMEDPAGGNYTRIATAGANIMKKIVNEGKSLSADIRSKFGGYGPLAPETDNITTMAII
eukprot:CFRG8080T1